MRQRISSPWLLVGVLGAATLSVGCSVNCTRTCTKLLACELNEDAMVLAECEDSCERQEVLFEIWEDDAKEAAFVEHQRCILGASCDELRDGTCYDSELFTFASDDS